MIRKVIIVISIITIIGLIGLVAAGFLMKDNTSNDNVITYFKTSTVGTKDTKLIGYFSNGSLENYELSYYIEYSDSSSAKDNYNRMIQNVQERDDIKYTYTLDNNKLYVKMNHIVAKFSEKTLKSIFKTTNNVITKKDFDDYAVAQGYTKQ